MTICNMGAEMGAKFSVFPADDVTCAHYAALGVSYVIYSQRIWSVERAGEGWRGMSNRGSATANHYDHVHVSVF